MCNLTGQIFKSVSNHFGSAWNGWRGYSSHWQQLGKFFKLPVIRLFIFWFAAAPIAVSALRDLPDKLAISHGDQIYTLSLELPFNWIVLWFASFSYALAFCVYQLRCPDFIKDYPNYAVYRGYQYSPRWLTWLTYYGWLGISEKEKLASRLIEKSLATPLQMGDEEVEKPKVTKSGTCWQFSHDGKRYQINTDENTPDTQQSEFFWEVFGRWSASRAVSRNITWVLVSIAILLTVSVVVQNIISVLFYIAR